MITTLLRTGVPGVGMTSEILLRATPTTRDVVLGAIPGDDADLAQHCLIGAGAVVSPDTVPSGAYVGAGAAGRRSPYVRCPLQA